jgi:hypothetical protein
LFNKKTTIRVSKVVYFSTFLDIFAVDLNALLPALVLPPERGGILVFGNGACHPFPRALEVLLGQVEASKLFFLFPKQEEVHWCQVRQVGGDGEAAGSPRRPASFDNGESVDGSVVPMEEPAPFVISSLFFLRWTINLLRTTRM